MFRRWEETWRRFWQRTANCHERTATCDIVCRTSSRSWKNNVRRPQLTNDKLNTWIKFAKSRRRQYEVLRFALRSGHSWNMPRHTICNLIFVLKAVSEQVKELERSKNYYVKKNKEQSKTVQMFISQITGKHRQPQRPLFCDDYIELAFHCNHVPLYWGMIELQSYSRRYSRWRKHKSKQRWFWKSKKSCFKTSERIANLGKANAEYGRRVMHV